MKKKTLIIILTASIIAMTLVLVYFFVIPNMDPVKRDVKKVSTVLFEIPGGSYYGDGFIISQGPAEDGKKTVFGLLITDMPFKANSEKALSWLQEQGVALESINYTCSPSQYAQATKEEIAACTHAVE